LLVLSTVTALPVIAAEGDWVLLDENQGSNFFLDKAATTVPKAGVLRVRTRVIYTDQGRVEALRTLASPKNLETLFESRYLYDLDCSEQESKLLEVSHLDKNGKVLKTTDLSKFTDWEAIPPEARMALVAIISCPK
jgi:hypothetical protein